MRFGRSEGGFTLIELAIVLVIIGIILGAVMKAQDLVANAKAKKLASMIRASEVYAWSYYDRHGEYLNGTTGLNNIKKYLRKRYGLKDDVLDLGDVKCGVSSVNSTDICWDCNGTGSNPDDAVIFYYKSVDVAIDGSINATGGLVRCESGSQEDWSDCKNKNICLKYNTGDNETTYY